MNDSQEIASAPELRQLVKECDRKVFTFCESMIADPELLEPLVVGLFTEFGKYYRKSVMRHRDRFTGAQLQVRLFQMAWDSLQGTMGQLVEGQSFGRDTRPMVDLGEDLLEKTLPVDEKLSARLNLIDPDLRAPVVLRDILKFSDEQAAQILGLRWGVYRHRLNRGRLDLCQFLRGRLAASPNRANKPKADLSV